MLPASGLRVWLGYTYHIFRQTTVSEIWHTLIQSFRLGLDYRFISLHAKALRAASIQ